MSSAEERVGACLARIAERDGEIRAWAYVDFDYAKAQARALDRFPRKGALHGIPIGVKDVLDTFDMPTQYGSSIYRDHHPSKDSACVAALRRAGALILGKTTTTEFASPIPVGVRNPLDFTRTPGVSSSGSAAAVADGMVPLALGTQTGGSVIRPAAYCGIYGYKASLDAMDRGGIRHLRPSLDSLGVFARSLHEIGLISGIRGDRRPRVGFCRTSEWPLAKPETQQALIGAARRLEAEEVTLPTLFEGALEAFRTIVLHESATAYAAEFRDHAGTMNEWLRDVASRSVPEGVYRVALRVAKECRAYLAHEVFSRFDVLITPATAGEASQKLTGLEDQTFCPLWTMMHGPCVTLPLFKGPNGMPMGLQVVGAVNRDAELIGACFQIERQLG